MIRHPSLLLYCPDRAILSLTSFVFEVHGFRVSRCASLRALRQRDQEPDASIALDVSDATWKKLQSRKGFWLRLTTKLRMSDALELIRIKIAQHDHDRRSKSAREWRQRKRARETRVVA